MQPDFPVKKLIMPRNKIGDDGAFCLSQALRDDSCRLELLNVAHNDISYIGIVSLLSALRKNTVIQFFNAEGNEFPPEEVMEQFVMLFEENPQCRVFQLPGLELYREEDGVPRQIWKKH